MGQRLRALILVLVLLGAGVLLGSAIAQWWQPATVTQQPNPEFLFSGKVRAEVLNGGGQSGVAREATRLLRDLGLDVVYFGNAEPFSTDPSVVFDRVGRPEDARKVADALGIREIRSEPDSDLYVDLTVRLGPEWKHPAELGVGESPPPPWWDIRRFFKKDEGKSDSIPVGS